MGRGEDLGLLRSASCSGTHHKHQQSGCSPGLVATAAHAAPCSTLPSVPQCLSLGTWRGRHISSIRKGCPRFQPPCTVQGASYLGLWGGKNQAQVLEERGLSQSPSEPGPRLPHSSARPGQGVKLSPARCKAAPAAGESLAAKPSYGLICPAQARPAPAPGPKQADTRSRTHLVLPTPAPWRGAAKHGSWQMPASSRAKAGKQQTWQPVVGYGIKHLCTPPTGAQRDPEGGERQ